MWETQTLYHMYAASENTLYWLDMLEYTMHHVLSGKQSCYITEIEIKGHHVKIHLNWGCKMGCIKILLTNPLKKNNMISTLLNEP